jgi:hypothetical protein
LFCPTLFGIIFDEYPQLALRVRRRNFTQVTFAWAALPLGDSLTASPAFPLSLGRLPVPAGNLLRIYRWQNPLISHYPQGKLWPLHHDAITQLPYSLLIAIDWRYYRLLLAFIIIVGLKASEMPCAWPAR